MIKAIILDIGNVLLKVDLSLWVAAFRKIGFNGVEQLFNNKEVRATIANSYGLGKMSTLELMTFLCQKGNCDNIQFTDFRDAWNSVITQLFEDAFQVIKALRKEGFQIYALSDNNEMHFDYIELLYQKTHSGEKFVELFDKCYLSHVTGHRKSQDAAWQDILNENGLLPEECMFVDDLQSNVERAANLGLLVFHYQFENTLDEVALKVAEINHASRRVYSL